MSADLRNLNMLARMIRDLELARLSDLSDKRQKAESELSALNTQHRDVIRAAGPDAAHGAGRDMVWLRWNREQSKHALQQAAKAAADCDAQLATARRAFGRAEALEGLVSRKR